MESDYLKPATRIRVSPLILGVSLFALLTVIPGRTAGIEFLRQTINVPAASGAWQSCLVDIDNDGLVDLLAVGPVENTLWISRQRGSGFPATPDQVLELPAQTAWLALCQVDKHSGLELLLSSA